MTNTVLAVAEDEEIQWVSLDEAKKLDLLIGKQFVHLFPDGKVDEKDAKLYFYKIISVTPCQPGNMKSKEGTANRSNFLLDFQIQKYHRDRHYEVKIKNSGTNGSHQTIQQNEPVMPWSFDPKMARITGDGMVITDPMASRRIDSRDFLKEFKAE